MSVNVFSFLQALFPLLRNLLFKAVDRFELNIEARLRLCMNCMTLDKELSEKND